MLRDYEYELFQRYRNSRVIDQSDKDFIYRFCGIGFMTLGIRTKDGLPRETARLTKRGLRQLGREEIFRSPIKKSLYAVVNTLFG